MKILVVGGTGLLGGHAALHLQSLGHQVSIAARKPAPAGTPMDIVNRIQQESAKAMGTPVLKERLLSQGAVPSGITSAEFARMIESEMRKWAQVVKASGATVD